MDKLRWTTPQIVEVEVKMNTNRSKEFGNADGDTMSGKSLKDV